jgi:methyl-accepting chemotaxis protein
MSDRSASPTDAVADRKAPGLSIAQKLISAFIGFILLLGLLLVLVYQQYVPSLVRDQIELRVESVARSFASATFKPMVERNYLRINKVAETTAALPDVAYAAAVNRRGIAVAGIFGDMDGFDRSFTELVKQKGFPKEIVEQTRLSEDSESAQTSFAIGGQEIIDFALRLPQTDAVVHVGIFTEGMEAAVRESLMPLLILLLVMTVAGSVTLMLVARTVSRPIRQLSEQAELISMGQLDRQIDIKAGGEIWQLAESFKRMQASIRYSVMQMRRQQKQ